MYRLIIDSHLKKKREKRVYYVIYDIDIKNFIITESRDSEFYSSFIKGDYITPLIPFILKTFNKVELDSLWKILFNNDGTTHNKLIRDKQYILKYISEASYLCKDKTYSLPSHNDISSFVNTEDFIWKSTTPIKEKKELFNGTKRCIHYYMAVIRKFHFKTDDHNIIITKDSLSNYTNSFDQIINVFISMKDIKASFEHDLIDKAKFIRDYIGSGSYTVLENGNIIVISNNIYLTEDNNTKLLNLLSFYGKRLRYHFVKTLYGDDLVIQLNPL